MCILKDSFLDPVKAGSGTLSSHDRCPNQLKSKMEMQNKPKLRMFH
jgi:hypothetical protein